MRDFEDDNRVDIEVRCVGYRTYEARTPGGLHSAIGSSRAEAIEALCARVPGNGKPLVRFIPAPQPA